MRNFLFLLLFSIPYAAKTDTCVDGQVRIPGYKESKIEKSSYCYSDNGVFYSTTCKDFKSCWPSTLMKEDFVVKEVGTPGSHACLAHGGQAQVVEYETKNKRWERNNRCVFADKTKFMDMGTFERGAR